MGQREFSAEEAKEIGGRIGVDWTRIPIDEFRMGLSVELEHGAMDTRDGRHRRMTCC